MLLLKYCVMLLLQSKTMQSVRYGSSADPGADNTAHRRRIASHCTASASHEALPFRHVQACKIHDLSNAPQRLVAAVEVAALLGCAGLPWVARAPPPRG
jgi:hypothetical protein